MTKLVTRKVAKAAGLIRYFTGKPCLRGHIAERWTMSGLCISCGNEHALKRQSANRAEFTARQREWRHANREHSNAYMRQWSREHPDAKAIIRKRNNEKNATQNALSKRRWVLANPEANAAGTARYRARKASAPGSFTVEDVEYLLEQQRYHCNNPRCRADVLRAFHIDHITPLSRGGTNWPDNIQILCARCNTSKGDRTMEEWLAQRV